MQAYDPENRGDYRRLKADIDGSCYKKRSREEQRMKQLRRLVGRHYGDDGCRESRPINMLELGVNIYQRGLASKQPEALCTSDYEELSPTGADFEIVLNRRMERARLQAALNICAVEALFTMGIMCTGVAIEGEFDAGKVFSEPVLFPDAVLDMNAKSWETQTFIGHDFLVPYDQVKDSPLYEGSGRDRFIRKRDAQYRSDATDWQRTRGEEFLDMVRLRQLWIPGRRKVIICDPEGSTQLPLMSNKWEGPELGPYRNLSFNVVPGNLFPLAPVPMWMDLDDIINKSFSKAARRTLNSKVIGLARSPDDAKAITEAPDMATIFVNDQNAILEQNYGGESGNQPLLGLANMSKMLLVYLGGNWDALGGLAPMSGTLGQDQLLSQGASGRMKDMQQKMHEFEEGVVADFAYWVWEDPLAEEKFTKKLEGTKFSMPETWTPESRKGEFFHYNFKVNLHAKVDRTPDEQAQGLTQILTQILLPALPFMQQGSPVDWEVFFKMIARYSNYPELNQIINWPGGDSIPQESPEAPAKPSNTTRTYERVSRPGASRAGNDQTMTNLLFGGKPQQAEQAALMQPMV